MQVQPPAIVARKRDDAAVRAMVALENLEDAMERRLEIGRARERLADVEQRRRLAISPL